MEKFWAVILIFVVVAAAGLMYVNQVYNPQKETQMTMADMANQTLSAVKLEIGDDSTQSEVSGEEAINIIKGYIEKDVNTTILINGTTYTGGIDNISGKIDSSSQYFMRETKDNGEITQISVIKI